MPLTGAGGIEIRQHQTVPYSSIYRADSKVVISERAYGVAVARSPVLCLSVTDADDMTDSISASTAFGATQAN